MYTLELNQLENISGGGDISDTISGLCGAISLAVAFKLIAISRTAAVVIAVGCVGNAAGGYFGWW